MSIPFRFLAAKIPEIGADAADEEDERLRKRLFVSTVSLVVVATAFWGVIFTLFGEPLAGIISIGYSIVSLLSILLFRLTRRYNPFLYIQLILGLLLPFSHTLLLGGLMDSSTVILWGLISPLGALFFFRLKQAVYWWLAYLVLLAAAGLAQGYITPGNNLPGWLVTLFFVLNLGAVSSIVMLLLNFFIRQKEEAYELLNIEQVKSENLLLNILPREIAAILKNEERTIADQFEGTSILFADLVGFTPLTAQMPPVEVVNLLNEVFSHFDSLVDQYGVEKIRTIGDNYMVAAGAPRPMPDHAIALCNLALDMRDFVCRQPLVNGQQLAFRIGINSGPVIGGVIGRKKFVYDVWGDAVNIASRMESQGEANKIHIAKATHDLVSSHFVCEPRGSVTVKGRGELPTWFLVDRADPKGTN
jgi:adenylate cyclase